MTEWLAAAAAFVLAVLGLGIGVMSGREPLRGSCGGLGNCSGCNKAGVNKMCSAAEDDP